MRGASSTRSHEEIARPPLRPEGCDGTPLSSVLLFLPDVPASTRRRLQSRGVPFATNIIVLMEVRT